MVDRRAARTRNLLHDAMLQLLTERPFDDITVTDIAERAQVARKTFYAHFHDKHELLWSSAHTMFERLAAATGNLDSDTLLADNKPLTYPVFKHVQDYAALYRYMLSEQGTAQFITRMMDYLAEMSYQRHAPLREASSHISVPPRFINHFLAGAVLSAVVWWLTQEPERTPEEMAYMFSQLAAPGVLSVMNLE